MITSFERRDRLTELTASAFDFLIRLGLTSSGGASSAVLLMTLVVSYRDAAKSPMS